MRRIYLYGFGDLCTVSGVEYLNVNDGILSTMALDRLASFMFDTHVGTRYIYAVENRPGLKDDFFETVKHPHFTKNIEFEDIVTRESVRFWRR